MTCGSFIDLSSSSIKFTYDESYPDQRHHDDPSVGKLKVKTLRAWLGPLDLVPADSHVCEVGFGSGSTLKYLIHTARRVYGIEAIDKNVERAAQMGVSKDNLFHFSRRPDLLPEKIDLWLFLDSFEHLEDPGAFLEWMVPNSSVSSRILIVCPRADSWSQKLLGRFWPHRRPDHTFHWSKKGLVELMEKKGFLLEKSFFPLKFVPLRTVLFYIDHYVHTRLNHSRLYPLVPNMALPFNIGEMGLLFIRKRASDAA